MNNTRCTGNIGPAAAHKLSMHVLPGYGADDMHITHGHYYPPAWRIYNIGLATACIQPGPSPHPNPARSDAAAAGYPWQPTARPAPAGRAILP